MPHINHRRGETRRSVNAYPWDDRSSKVRGFRVFRAVEAIALRRVRGGTDPDAVAFPVSIRANDNPWNYD